MTNQPYNTSSEDDSARNAIWLLWRAFSRTWADLGALDRTLLAVVLVVSLFVIAGVFR